MFLFGTRLSNITRQLRHRDPEVAFQTVAHIVPDWSGGTRIGEDCVIGPYTRIENSQIGNGVGAIDSRRADGLEPAAPEPPPV